MRNDVINKVLNKKVITLDGNIVHCNSYDYKNQCFF